MTGSIYLLDGDGKLEPMTEQPYDSESLLQELLANYPNMLAGEQMNPDAPRRWMLIRREAGIPDREGAGNRWAVDHLFLDQDAIPTLVEVKRGTDSRIRREVVGQMLDYAANAVVHWPMERIRAEYEAQCEAECVSAEERLQDFLGDDCDDEVFWTNVKTNLRAGRVRMVFVSDVMPAELTRIVEFLNEQMDPAEVLAVEVRQYVGEGRSTLVPRVVGQSAQAQQKKSVSAERRRWDQESFFAELTQRVDTEGLAVARRLVEWGVARGLRLEFGEGRKMGSIFLMLDIDGEVHWTFALWTNGSVEIQFEHMLKRPAFAPEARRRELRERLNRIPGVSIPEGKLSMRPSIVCSLLATDEALSLFTDAFGWYIAEVQATTGGRDTR